MSQSLKMLVVDTDPGFRTEVARSLARAGITVTPAGGISEARDLAAGTSYEAVLVDLDLPEEGGLELVDELVAASPAPMVLVAAHHPQTRRVVEAIRRGAADVLEKPLSPHRLTHLLLSRRRPSPARAPEGTPPAAESLAMVGSGPAWRSVLERASRVAATRDTTVLLQGESGTGKELIARSIHGGGQRRERPFVTLNCAALNENLLEAELCGFEKGALTGATREGKPGVLDAADGGTVLLEEIGDLPAGLQVKLLRYLQDRRFKRVGGVRDEEADVRIIAATTRDLWRDVEKGRFREDLYFRISEMPIVLPPLRERREDIVELAGYFLRRFVAAMHKTLRGFSPEAEELLVGHDWIGNVRELRNVCEYAAILCDGDLVEPHHLALQHQRAVRRGAREGELTLPLKSRSLREMEQELIRVVLTENRFNVTRAARALGINRSTLYNKMRDYGLHREPARELQQSG